MVDTKLSEIMTVNPRTVRPLDSFEVVDEVFNENNFHHLPVVDDVGKLVGILSKSDFLLLCDSMTSFNVRVSDLKNKKVFSSMLVKDVMQRKIARLKPDDTALVAAGFFKENLFHAIPIINKDDKLVGIVTTYDLLNLAF